MQRHRVFLISILALFLVSCSSDKRGSFVDSENESSDSSYTQPAQGIYTKCNVFTGNSSISGALGSTNYSQTSIYLDITTEPTDFNAKLTYLKFEKWGAIGNAVSDPEPIEFYIENPYLVVPRLIGPFQKLDFDTLRTQLGGSTIQQTQIVLPNLSSEYHVVRIGLYRHNDLNDLDDDTNVSYFDLLLPNFLADPNAYATTHSPALHPLHPLWEDRNLNLTPRGFYGRLPLNHRYCN